MFLENIKELKNIKGYLMFTLVFENEITEEVSLEVSCGDDIEEYMRLYFNRKWLELFNNWYDPSNFQSASFNGMKFVDLGEDVVQMQIYGNYKMGKVAFDLKTLNDNNADKLKKIREIVNE